MQPLSLPSNSPSIKERQAAFNSPQLSPSINAPSANQRKGSVGLGFAGLPNGAANGSGSTVTVAQNTRAASADELRVTSPQELTIFVDNLLTDLESRFDVLSTDVLSRLNSLSTRIDSLEGSISDLLSGTAGGPVPGDEGGPPLEGTEGVLRRSESGKVSSKV
ncbi:hypothetical protein T439DRAFT_359714 [Meredithblackwellia eburnea MCA 4105]